MSYVCITPFKVRIRGKLYIGKLGDTFESIPSGGDWLGPGWVKPVGTQESMDSDPAPAPKPKRKG